MNRNKNHFVTKTLVKIENENNCIVTTIATKQKQTKNQSSRSTEEK